MKFFKIILTLILIIPTVYAQTIFESVKKSFDLIPAEYMNIIVSAIVLYSIIKYGVSFSIKDNSSSNIIATTLASAGTYLIYTLNIPFFMKN